MLRMSKKRYNISLDEKIKELGETMAKKMGLTFSAYLSVLISNDANGIIVPKEQSIDNELNIKSEVPQEDVSQVDKLLGGDF